MLNWIVNISLLLILASIAIISLRMVSKFSKQRKREFFIIKFADYMTTLEYFEAKAYDIIYKDQLFIYSIEATKVDDNQFAVTAKDFSRLVFKLMGDKLVEEFTSHFGMETLIFNIMEYFNNRYEEDEIREASVKNLMDSDIEETK